MYEQVTSFNQVLIDIFSNYIPKAVDDKDPSWMNESIKKKIMARKYACKYFNVNKKNYDVFLKLQTISTTLPEMILKRNVNYYCLP